MLIAMIGGRLICRKVNLEFLKFVHSTVLVKASGCCLTDTTQALTGLASVAVTVSQVLPTHCLLCFSPQVSQCVSPAEGFSVNV